MTTNVLSGRALENLKKILDQPAITCDVEYRHILDWAQDPEMGGLDVGASARGFAAWLDEGWNDWADDDEMTVKSVLEGAVSAWCGGRTL